MTTQINQDNIQASTLAELGSGPTVTNIQITNSSYVVLDDTAVSTSGGYIRITGTNFASGCEVIIGSTNATAVAFVSSTVLNVQVPALSAGTYVVYVVNSDGSVAIRVNGLTFSGTPTWVTGSTLTGGAVNVAISIQLSATGDAPLTYTLASGSSLPSGLTLTSGGLLSGTITGITVDTIYNFTIDVADAQSQESPRSFSITITAGDQYFLYVSTLLSATALTLPFNNDASTNNFLVTVVGDTKPNNFNPYTPGYYSNYFDGTGDYLTVPNNSALLFDSGNFTVEAWSYITAMGAERWIAGFWSYTSPGNQSWVLYAHNGNSGYSFAIQGTGAEDYVVLTVANSVVLNQWTHVAVTRSGSTWRMFINGTLSATTTYSGTLANCSNVLGVGVVEDAPAAYVGYISNLRVVKGTAVYTSAFTPPTTPLTAIANTSLLTCQSNRFIDNSTNAFTITRVGDTLVSGFDPFVPATEFAGRGSTYFDGTTDLLTLGGTGAVVRSSGSFTIEGWYYPTSSATAFRAVYSSGTGYATAGRLYQNNTALTFYWGPSSSITGSIGWTLNTWNHFAVTWNGTTTKVYINGQESVSSNSPTYSGTTDLSIGESTYSPFGYISNFRISNSVIYTAAFTPPTEPLTAVSGTSLLTLQTNQPANNNAFLDSSTNNFLVTRNGNTTQGSFSPYGPLWSTYFDGTGDYLTIPYSASMVQWWDTDYTIEMWVYNVTNSQTSNAFPLQVAYGLPAQADTYWAFGTLTNGTLMFYYYNGGPVTSAVSTATVPLNTWTHVAMVYTNSSTTLRGYINGVQAFSVSKSGTPQGLSGQTVNLGAVQATGYNGYISNLRIVRGTAVYTSAFTPSTSPLTAIANTSLLTCTDNRFIDESPNNFAITRAGDVSVQRFSPFRPQTVTTFYSGYFDGTATSTAPLVISTASGQLNLPEDFTIELWFYDMGTSKVLQQFAFQSSGGFGCGINAFDGNATRKLDFRQNGGSLVYGVTAITPNVWNHAAFVRSGTAFRIFLNGVLDYYNANYTTSFTSSSTNIGSAANGDTGYSFLGYISNFRIVKGTAVYTTSSTTIGAQIFTPPTSPLTAIANTGLLTCQSATFIDNSTNNFTITVNGNSTPRTVAPFTPTATTGVSYSPSVYGGSMYFDGSGDYLTVSPSTTTYLSNRAFTIEAWVYLNANDVILVSRRAAVSARGFFFSYGNVTSNKFSFNAGDTDVNAWNVQLTSTDTFSLRQWHHVAITRNSSNVFTLWVNGVSQATGTASFTIADDTSNLLIGTIDSGSGPMNGYISNLRIITGQALYTSNFAPPVSPLLAIQNNVLLLNGTSAGIYDMSMMNNYETVGNTSLVTNIEKYGNSSLYFDGTGDYLLAPASQNIVFGTGNFTIECWLYLTATGVDDGVIIENRSSGASTSGFVFNTRGVAGGYKINFYVGGFNITPNSVTYSSWNHIAVTRSSGTVRIFLNGVIDLTVTINTNLTNSSMTIGQSLLYANSNITGYIDDLRITRGVARYTANFTPTSSPFITF